MKFPLPEDTRKLLEKNIKTSNLGLLLNKYVSAWSDDWTTEQKRGKDKVNLKSDFLNKIEKQSICIKEGKAFIESLCKRQSAMIQGLKSSRWHVESFTAATDSRLIIGLGGTSVIETGMTLHPLYGFPYLPGSGLKGLARAYAEIGVDAQKEELFEVLGSEDKDPRHATNNRQGKVFFMDGLPNSFPKLELDIMNPHYGDYYQGIEPKPPADYLNPVPVTFLAVASDETFSFAVCSKDKELAEKARQWLVGGLTELGAGGKTNVGYGYFKILQQQQSSSVPIITTSSMASAISQKDDLLKAKLKSVKNPETFSTFIKQIRSEDIPHLMTLSFKGMESVINIGLVTVLEAAEISGDIKQIIAKKIFEVCKEPDKKHPEKLEKYKKLKLMAGEKG